MEQLIIEISNYFFVKRIGENTISIITSKKNNSCDVLSRFPQLKLIDISCENRYSNQYDFYVN